MGSAFNSGKTAIFSKLLWALPCLVALYRTPEVNKKIGLKHKTPPELMRGLLGRLLHWFPEKKFIFTGDQSFGTHDLSRFAYRHRLKLKLISRFHPNASLHTVPALRLPGKAGRTRIKGTKLPSPEETVNKTKRRMRLTVKWYGGGEHKVEVITGAGQWYKKCQGIGGQVSSCFVNSSWFVKIFMRKTTPMKHYWVFDLDGTLVDSFGHYFLALDQIFANHGAHFGPEHRLPSISQSLPEFLEAYLGPEIAATALTEFHSKTSDDASEIKPFGGIPETLEYLANRGARIAVWTSRDFTSANQILQHTGISKFVEKCISGTCTINQKPHPEGLLKIIEFFGCTPDSVTVVGDHEYDVAAARSIESRAIRASWHSYWPIKHCNHSHHQFFSVSEFQKWLDFVPNLKNA